MVAVIQLAIMRGATIGGVSIRHAWLSSGFCLSAALLGAASILANARQCFQDNGPEETSAIPEDLRLAGRTNLPLRPAASQCLRSRSVACYL